MRMLIRASRTIKFPRTINTSHKHCQTPSCRAVLMVAQDVCNPPSHPLRHTAQLSFNLLLYHIASTKLQSYRQLTTATAVRR